MGQRKNILGVYLFGNVLNPKGSGGESRAYHLATQLAKENSVIIIEPEQFFQDVVEQSQLKVKTFKGYTPSSLTDFNISFLSKLYKIIKESKIDIIYIQSPFCVVSAKLIAKLSRGDIPVIYAASNAEYDRVRKLEKSHLPLYKRIGAPIYIAFIERLAVKFANHVISVSERDKNLFMKEFNVSSRKVTVIPNGVDSLEVNSLKKKDEIRNELGINYNNVVIVFHGSYSYPPNREAISLITNYIAPKIREINNNITFVIAGKDVPKFDESNVKSVGFVDDLYSFLNASDIAIVPLLSGGGTKTKVFDYMSVGLPVISTKKGMEGIEAESGRDAMIVDDVDEEFIESIKYLTKDEDKRKELGKNAKTLVEEKYDWERLGEKLRGLFEELSNGRKEENK